MSREQMTYLVQLPRGNTANDCDIACSWEELSRVAGVGYGGHICKCQFSIRTYIMLFVPLIERGPGQLHPPPWKCQSYAAGVTPQPHTSSLAPPETGHLLPSDSCFHILDRSYDSSSMFTCFHLFGRGRVLERIAPPRPWIWGALVPSP